MSLRTRNHSQSSPHLSRGFFSALICFSFFFSTAIASSKTSLNPTIHGRTIDTEGHIVPYVSLIFTTSEIFVLSDKDGYFIYNAPLYQGDSIFVNRIGFKNRIITAEYLFQNNEIILIPTVLSAESVEIQVSGINSPTALPEMGRYTKTSGSGSMDHGKLLGRVPGVSIKAYGGPAGISTLSMDGGPSSHIKVLVDGINISSAQNGEADLSQLPLPFIESMSYIPFDIGQSENGGSDGTIRLESGKPQNHIALSQGSFGHQAYDINFAERIFGLWASLQFGQRREQGNYPVVWDKQELERQNNGLDQRFAGLRLHGMIKPNIFFLLTALESRQSRGVAGLVWSPNEISHRNDKLQLIGSTLGWIRPAGNSHMRFSVRRSAENYTNPSLLVNSDHHLESYQLEFSDQQTLGKHFSLISGINMYQDNIRSTATSRHTRNSYIASLAPIFQTYRDIRIIPGIKLHYSPDLYKQALTDLQLQIPIGLGPISKFAASRGEVYRYPSFNDQYWEPGGNPNLKPEESEILTAQLHLDFEQFGDLTLQWQQKESSNLIQWMPVHSYWQPGNVQSARRASTKAIWNFESLKLDISGFAHVSLIETEDRTIKKALRYAPEQTAALGVTWTPSSWEMNILYNYVSDRISMYDYPEDTILDATSLWSLSAAYTWNLSKGPFTLILSGDNLQNVQYETIRGYPEPGRSVQVNARYVW